MNPRIPRGNSGIVQFSGMGSYRRLCCFCSGFWERRGRRSRNPVQFPDHPCRDEFSCHLGVGIARDTCSDTSPIAQAKEPNVQAKEPNAQAREPNVQAREPNVQAREPNVQAREPNVQAREPNAQASEPNAQAEGAERASEGAERQAREPNAQAREPNAKRREPNVWLARQPDSLFRSSGFQRPCSFEIVARQASGLLRWRASG